MNISLTPGDVAPGDIVMFRGPVETGPRISATALLVELTDDGLAIILLSDGHIEECEAYWLRKVMRE